MELPWYIAILHLAIISIFWVFLHNLTKLLNNKPWNIFASFIITTAIFSQFLLYIANIITYNASHVPIKKGMFHIFWSLKTPLLQQALNNWTVLLSLSITTTFFCCFWIIIHRKKLFIKTSKIKPLTLCISTGLVLILIFTLHHKSHRIHLLTSGELILNTSDNYQLPQTKKHQTILAKLNEKDRREYHPNNGNGKNVILIIADALRMDYVFSDSSLTPFLHTLRDTNQLTFSANYAYSSCSNSACGILSTLSSKSFPNLSYEGIEIQEVLKKAGYKTNFYLSGIHQAWLINLIDFYNKDNIDLLFNRAEDSLANDKHLIEALKNQADYANTPNFFYFHFMSTHIASIKNKEYIKYLPTIKNPNPLDYMGQQPDTEETINNYKNGVYQFDQYLKETLKTLKNKGYLDNFIIVIVSDHGESLGEDNNFGHGKLLNNIQTHIPLLIIDPSISTKKYNASSRHTTHIDISPTILDSLNITKPPSWEGASLLKKIEGEYCTLHITEHLSSTQNKFHKKATICSNKGKIYKYTEPLFTNIEPVELFRMDQKPDEEINDAELINHYRKKLKQLENKFRK